MYETTDEYGIKSSIGKAAEDYLFTSELRQQNVIFDVTIDPATDYRDGTY